MKKTIALFIFASLLLQIATGQTIPQKAFWVCGDTKVLLVDYNASKGNIPKVIWSWDSKNADLPKAYVNKFKTVDDCKTYNDKVLISASSGGVAVVDIKTKKTEFYAEVAMAHSVEMLPDGLLAAAASTNVKGNGIFLFDINKSNKPVFKDSLYSAHGVVWDRKRKCLYALGYKVLREYKLDVQNKKLILKKHWDLPGTSGHDLQMAPDGDRLFITQVTGTCQFDIKKAEFKAIEGFPDSHDIKSIGLNQAGQFIYTKTEQSWWTFHVKFLDPERIFQFPDMKVYKARWY